MTERRQTPVSRARRLLIGQLVANGDCLYATTVARQIKQDEPECHLTWAISANCRALLDRNPHVDAVWEIPPFRLEDGPKIWWQFEDEARARRTKGEFDEIFFTQLSPGFVHRFDGSIRSSIFRGYPRPITVSVAPVIQLYEAEIRNVKTFAERNRLSHFRHVILFECAPRSGQSFVTPEFALETARCFVRKHREVCFVLSSHMQIDAAAFGDTASQIVDASSLSFRENAELTKYCSLLVGCSSGITWLASSEWAKPLPMVQLLARDAIWSNSVVQDHERWGLPVAHIIEMADVASQRVTDCLATIFNDGFAAARTRFHETMEPNFRAYECGLRQFLREGNFKRAALLFLNVVGHRRVPARKLFRLGMIALAFYPAALGRRIVEKKKALSSWRRR